MSNYTPKQTLIDRINATTPPDSTCTVRRLSSNAMYFEGRDKKTNQYFEGIVYMRTVVAYVTDTKGTPQITLRNDGRKSMTTKKWINEIINNYGYRLNQKNYKRTVERHVPNMIDEVVDFEDGMVL